MVEDANILVLHMEIYLLNDQPTTCPYCGARTDFMCFFSYKCKMANSLVLNSDCGFVFMGVED